MYRSRQGAKKAFSLRRVFKGVGVGIIGLCIFFAGALFEKETSSRTYGIQFMWKGVDAKINISPYPPNPGWQKSLEKVTQLYLMTISDSQDLRPEERVLVLKFLVNHIGQAARYIQENKNKPVKDHNILRLVGS